METLITVIHYCICLFLIGAILLQSGKGADVGAAFGAGSSQALFGPRGAATFLNKLTAAVAIGFMFTSLGLVMISRNKANHSVFEKAPAAAAFPETAPSETLPSAPPSAPLTTPEEKK